MQPQSAHIVKHTRAPAGEGRCDTPIGRPTAALGARRARSLTLLARSNVVMVVLFTTAAASQLAPASPMSLSAWPRPHRHSHVTTPRARRWIDAAQQTTRQPLPPSAAHHITWTHARGEREIHAMPCSRVHYYITQARVHAGEPPRAMCGTPQADPQQPIARAGHAHRVDSTPSWLYSSPPPPQASARLRRKCRSLRGRAHVPRRHSTLRAHRRNNRRCATNDAPTAAPPAKHRTTQAHAHATPHTAATACNRKRHTHKRAKAREGRHCGTPQADPQHPPVLMLRSPWRSNVVMVLLFSTAHARVCTSTWSIRLPAWPPTSPVSPHHATTHACRWNE